MKSMSPAAFAMVLASMFGGTTSQTRSPSLIEGRSPAEHQRRKASAQAKRDRRRLRAGGAA